jgi:hypothetical protein
LLLSEYFIVQLLDSISWVVCMVRVHAVTVCRGGILGLLVLMLLMLLAKICAGRGGYRSGRTQWMEELLRDLPMISTDREVESAAASRDVIALFAEQCSSTSH